MARIDPHSYTDTAQAVTRHLSLDLTVDFEARVLVGTAALDLTGCSGDVLDLDTRGLEIASVTDGDGAPLSWTVGEDDEILGQRLRIGLKRGVERVIVEYATGAGATALQWLTPAQTAGGVHPYLFSQCQPHHARSMVPVQDSPQVRFTYDATLRVPEALTVVMSAAPGERTDGEDGTAVWRFDMPQALPAYLLALAAGDLRSQDLGPRTRVWAEPPTLEASAYEFADAEAMLTAAEELFGPYLWDRFDFLVMPPSFPYGGMENPRLTFLTPTLLAGDRSLVFVLAHELAHSWTGNLVTNATMNDFWLNEGFTVWSERRILAKLEGEGTHALRAAIGRQGLDGALTQFGEGSPYTKLHTDLDGVDPDSVYSLVPYEKGFLFVSLLEETVGSERFDAFIKAYIERFRFTSITTAQFEAFLDEALPGVAETIQAQRWIHEPGIPENCPTFASPHLQTLQAAAKGWADGRPDAATMKAWDATDWQIFLGDLAGPITRSDCQWLDETFGLTESKNAEILGLWLGHAAKAGYAPAYPRIKAFLTEVGRMKFLKPLYAALLEGEETGEMARLIYAENQASYHPIAQMVLDGLFAAKA